MAMSFPLTVSRNRVAAVPLHFALHIPHVRYDAQFLIRHISALSRPTPLLVTLPSRSMRPASMGSAVAQLVRQFFPALRTFAYNPEVKTRLVMKAWDVISKGRLEFDAGAIDVAQSLMAIRKTITPGGRQFTYTAGRNEATGHADLAWALFHALHNEPLEGQTPTNTRIVEIF